jgi:two-component system nitrate/nitrite response regulator NarL
MTPSIKVEKQKPIRLLLVDDHPIVLSGLRNAFSGNSQFEIVGEATNGVEAVEKTEQTAPDVVLMDISLPIITGLEATKAIRKTCPETRVLVLTIHEDKEYASEMIRAGANGYMLKDSSPADLIDAIETVYRGGTFFSPSIARMLLNEFLQPSSSSKKTSLILLSEREQEVLALVAEGLPNPDIAERLDVSIRTVEKHRENIKRKLNATTDAELTKHAIREGLVNLK